MSSVLHTSSARGSNKRQSRYSTIGDRGWNAYRSAKKTFRGNVLSSLQGPLHVSAKCARNRTNRAGFPKKGACVAWES